MPIIKKLLLSDTAAKGTFVEYAEKHRKGRTPMEPQLFFALDVNDYSKAMSLVDDLVPYVDGFKVGLELFSATGPMVLQTIKRCYPQTQTILDLKLHDIPATVGRAAQAINNSQYADYLTVHVGTTGNCIKAAADAVTDTKILGITVLTSTSQDDLLRREGRKLKEMVADRAVLAKQKGAAGVVCSGLEAPHIRSLLGPEVILATPGILPTDTDDDQKRVVTPEIAVANGSNIVIVGRPIRDAESPKVVAASIKHELIVAFDHKAKRYIH